VGKGGRRQLSPGKIGALHPEDEVRSFLEARQSRDNRGMLPPPRGLKKTQGKIIQKGQKNAGSAWGNSSLRKKKERDAVIERDERGAQGFENRPLGWGGEMHCCSEKGTNFESRGGKRKRGSSEEGGDGVDPERIEKAKGRLLLGGPEKWMVKGGFRVFVRQKN